MDIKHWRPKTLAGILNFYLSLGLITMTLILSVSGYYFISHILQNALEQKAQALAEQVATTTLDAVLLNEYQVIERLAADLVEKTPDLMSIYIENQHHQVLAQIARPEALKTWQKQPGLVILKPLMFLNNPAGQVRLVFSKHAITQPLLQLSLLVALALLIMLGLLFLAVQKLLSHHLIQPVTQLCEALSSPQKVLYEPLQLKQNLPKELLIFNQAISDLQFALQKHIQSLEQAHRFSAQATENLCQSQRLVTVGQLAAGLAHNLNTPLANIIGYAQIALSQTKDEKLQKRLAIIERQAKTCSEQVKNLLQASKPPKLHLQPTDLVVISQKVIEMISPVVRQKVGGRLFLNPNEPAMTLIDVPAFEQVLFNLINNAIEASATEVKVNIATFGKANPWQITIEDNGSGIPKPLQQTIFKPFVSTKINLSETISGNAGTGLGLFLAQTILNQMNGSIKLISSTPSGSCFEITLPKIPANQPNKETSA